MEKIDRFDFDCYVDSQEGESWAVLDKWKHKDGDYVYYDDHERVVAEMQDMIDDLQNQLETMTKNFLEA